MGFRFKRFDYVGGVSPLTGSNFDISATDAMNRAKLVIADFADFIISCGKGWSLDTTRNSTTSDFVDVPIWNNSETVQSYKAPGFFFVNTNGCKLFLSVIPTSCVYGIALDKANAALDIVQSGTQQTLGVLMSMIPAESSNTFGSTFDSAFLPSDATLIRGTIQRQANMSGGMYTPLAYRENGHTYSYGLFVDSYCVGISGSHSSTSTPDTLIPGYFVGRILGTLAHDESSYQSRYGSISFSFANYSSYDREFYAKPIIDESNNQFDRYGSQFSTALNPSVTGSSDAWKALCDNYLSVTKPDGTRLTAAAGNIRFMSDVVDIMDSKVTSSVQSGATRWVPYEVAVCTNDLSTYGIVPGDGFKGYLDTNLFRCGLVTLNQLYNNGTFCGWNYMLMIGWDPSNTDSL